MIDRFLRFTDKESLQKISPFRAAIVHLALAAAVFSPFFVSGEYILGSKDNYHDVFPNLLLMHQEMHQGVLGLWNPYLQGGIDQSASAYSFIFSPLFWLNSLTPENYFYYGLTLLMFLQVWLVGVFGFLFFREELEDSKWALFSSVVYQIGGYLFLTISVTSYLTIYLLMTVAAYLIHSLHKRKAWVSCLLLTLSMALIIFSGHIHYGFAAVIFLLLFFAYRYLSFFRRENSGYRYLELFAVSFISAMTLSMVRILPFLAEVFANSDRLESVPLWVGRGQLYLALTAFVPEVLGIHFSDSIHWLETVTTYGGVHTQFHTLNYFGALPILLFLIALIFARQRKVYFWLAIFLISALWFIRVTPISEMLDVLTFPYLHAIIPKMLIPIPFCVIIGHTAKYLEENPEAFHPRWGKTLLGTAVFFAMLVMTFYSMRYRDHLPQFCLIVTALWSVYLSLVILFRNRPNWAGKFSAGAAAAVFLAGLIMLKINLGGAFGIEKLNIRQLYLIFWSAAMVQIAGVWLFVEWRALKSPKLWLIFFKGAMAGAFLAAGFTWFYPFQYDLNSLADKDIYLIAGLGYIRFLFLTMILCAALQYFKARRINGSVFFLVVFLVAVLDLVAYNKVYGNISGKPFFQSPLYPLRQEIFHHPQKFVNVEANELTREKIDAKNFRVNQPHAFLYLQKEPLFANIFTVYGLRSYAGNNADISGRFYNFLYNFNPDFYLVNWGVAGIAHNGRFLDLMGCRYDVNDQWQRLLRPNALSRFMLFQDFAVVKNEQKALDMLNSERFDPNRRIILAEAPFESLRDSGQTARKLNYQRISNDILKVSVNADKPSILFFGDSFHPGWKAFVNGAESKVFRADYLFMAVPVPAGTSSVVWAFNSKVFNYGIFLLFLGFLSMAVSIWYFISRDRR